MKVTFSKETKGDFDKHRDYLRRTTKSDGHKYQKYELDSINNSLKKTTITDNYTKIRVSFSIPDSDKSSNRQLPTTIVEAVVVILFVTLSIIVANIVHIGCTPIAILILGCRSIR